MTYAKLTLSVGRDLLAVCKLDPDAPVPTWAFSGDFCSVTRTQSELSIICPESSVPEGVLCDAGWRCLRVAGSLDFEQIGIFASLASPLAAAGISIFPIATYDTDHILVKQTNLETALRVLLESGHQVQV